MQESPKYEFTFDLVHDDSANIEQIYELNRFKYKQEDNFLYEGKLCLLTEDKEFKVETNCFLTKDGIVIVEDWELAKEFINDDNPYTEIVFYKQDSTQGYKVLLDDEIQWMRADAPDVALPDNYLLLDEPEQHDYEDFKDEIKNKFKY